MPTAPTVIAFAARQALRNHRIKALLARRREPHSAALLLSGGGNLGYFHLGVIKVLAENQLLPRVISGSSAGSLMAALVGTRTERELERLDEDKLGLLAMIERQEGPATSEGFCEALEVLLPDVTFAEAAELSGRAINISIAAPDGGGIVCGPHATPHVLLRDAVRASCAVPMVFEPVVIRQRKRGRIVPFRGGRAWVDGSLYADIPANVIKHRYGVRHTIVSMVNPAVRPFVNDDDTPTVRGSARNLMLQAARSAAIGWASVGRARAGPLPKVRKMFDVAHGVMRQSYGGDLVLTPSKRFFPLGSMLEQPTRAMIDALSSDGEARTRGRLADLRLLAG